jgi:hypothetical protein
LAVTFTLDLRALLAAPAAFALTGADAADDDARQNEPIELLHALRSHARKLTIFSQVGEIALPPSRRIFAFLEQTVVPVRAPLGGVVHPKVWVLRYEAGRTPGGGEPRERRLRVLIASRNLTFDASWDTVLRLDEATDGRGADLGAVGDLFEGLVPHAGATISADHARRVSALSAALGEARFALPAGVDDLSVHVLGLTPGASPLPSSADRSLIISPFLSDDFFTQTYRAPVDELVSRPESLDLLHAGTFERVCRAYAFDDGSVVDLGADTERLSGHDPGRPLVGLHAKLFAFEHGGRAWVFFGSANATGAAFARNVEILVELVGPVAKLGIDRLCEGTEDERGLRALFATYSASDPGLPEDGDAPGLDTARRAIAGLAIDGFVEESGSGWAITYRSTAAVPTVDASIHCWPLASPGNRRPVAGGEPLQARFETTLETISGFLAFEIIDEQENVTKFVVPVPLHGVPENRERLLLKALIGNAERFLRYLLALLDEDATTMDLLDLVDATSAEGSDDGIGAFALPVLEKLLRTMRRDPGKLAGIHPLVADLAADDALPPGFAELWTTIYEVAVSGGRP